SQNLTFSGGASLTNGRGKGGSATGSYRNDSLINSLKSGNSDRSDRFSANFSGSWIKKLNGSRTNIKFAGSAAGSYSLSRSQWQNVTQYYYPENLDDTRQYQEKMTDILSGDASVTLTQKIGKTLCLEPLVTAGYLGERINRTQGVPAETEEIIDSLSPVFSNRYISLKPGIRQAATKVPRDRSLLDGRLKACRHFRIRFRRNRSARGRSSRGRSRRRWFTSP
ncbi:MAG: hypothetical protein WCJ18_06705, partial [Planctomycetota bacterium]